MPQDGSPPLFASTQLRLMDPLAVPDWDQQIAGLPTAGFFHTAAWARVLHGTYGYRPSYLVRQNRAGNMESLLPLMEVDSWLTGRRGVALPFTDEAGPVGENAESLGELLVAAQQLGRRRRWRYLELRGGREIAPEAPASTTFLHHELLLLNDPAILFPQLADSVRRAIRKAESGNLQVEFSQGLAAMRDFYELLCLTRRRHGVPPQPFPFFAQIQRHVMAPGHGWIVLARQGKVPVAGAVYFHHGREAIYKYGASDETKQQLRANNLVMWQAIQRYAREGKTRLDFGRTSLANEGLRKFKLGWRTREKQIDYLRYDFRQESYVTAADEAHGWHNHVFRALPLPLSRLAGTLLYRHMA